MATWAITMAVIAISAAHQNDHQAKIPTPKVNSSEILRTPKTHLTVVGKVEDDAPRALVQKEDRAPVEEKPRVAEPPKGVSKVTDEPFSVFDYPDTPTGSKEKFTKNRSKTKHYTKHRRSKVSKKFTVRYHTAPKSAKSVKNKNTIFTLWRSR